MVEEANEEGVETLPNIGPVSARLLARAGIVTATQLRQLGSLEAYRRMRMAGVKTNAMMVYALEAGLLGIPWPELRAEWKAEIRTRVHAINAEEKCRSKGRHPPSNPTAIADRQPQPPVASSLRQQIRVPGQSLAKRLGLPVGGRILVLGSPMPYYLFFDEPLGATEIQTDVQPPERFIHWFVTNRETFPQRLPALVRSLSRQGVLWVSWRSETALEQQEAWVALIREAALTCGCRLGDECPLDFDWTSRSLTMAPFP